MSRMLALCLLFGASMAALGCGDDDDLDSEAEARRAYFGFDRAVDRAINLGFDGFNAATNANIPEQSEPGDVGGTMTISGQVDQGASDNKEMRLLIDVIAYQDAVFDDPQTELDESLAIIYDLDEAAGPPALDLSLRNIPNGTFTGTLIGTFVLSGDIEAAAEFNLTLAGAIEDSGGDVIRSPGTLTITGTVTSADGVFNVNVTN